MKCFVLGAVGFIVSLSVKMLRGKIRVLEMHSLSLLWRLNNRGRGFLRIERNPDNATKFKADSFQRAPIRGYKFLSQNPIIENNVQI